ncbi:hypothetical protein BH11ARM2_BH11ARM2_09470 [soil metagenome]
MNIDAITITKIQHELGQAGAIGFLLCPFPAEKAALPDTYLGARNRLARAIEDSNED